MTIPLLGALNTASEPHLLDHIAPLSTLLDIPLIFSNEDMYELAQKYYPHTRAELWPDLEFRFQELAFRFDALIECKYFQPHLKEMFETLYKKKMRLIFCPHGQSDKGFSAPLLAPYAMQDIVLLYGDLQIEMLKKLQIWDQIQNPRVIGNYRLLYYQMYQKELDLIAEQEIFSHVNPNKKTVLYAPTWDDADKATSFFTSIDTILTNLTDFNVIVKIHPLLEMRSPSKFYQIAAKIEKFPNVHLVSTFPLVYPILNKVDYYLGDASSVGYDFLFFEKPISFFPHPNLEKGSLHQAGTLAQQKIYFEEKKKEQKSLYTKAFGKNITLQEFKNQILL